MIDRLPPAPRLALVLATSMASPGGVLAQWLDYPTPGIPRTESGAPDLTAPAPRTADGKPSRLRGQELPQHTAACGAERRLAPRLPVFLQLPHIDHERHLRRADGSGA